ncbi:hypothetical protein LLS1_23920 [Leifsonia sp. LS1]|uniref:hypothetical protein n=1 Tax=Leifsonia sp. LS1 TaxID=2828483 RepID=UPI001CFE6266|nr:hypothetical protein [Leifsonia sp. LS1]GIT80723.1 hypothetical protein LLS1_23920 [Leifsonia sp. LS1]
MTDIIEQDDTDSADALREAERVTWRSPVEGLWVAETPSDYLGMVDRNHDGFVATGATGLDLGVFPTREAAQLAVYTRWFAADEPAGLSGRMLPIASATAVAVALPALVIGVAAAASMI